MSLPNLKMNLEIFGWMRFWNQISLWLFRVKEDRNYPLVKKYWICFWNFCSFYRLYIVKYLINLNKLTTASKLETFNPIVTKYCILQKWILHWFSLRWYHYTCHYTLIATDETMQRTHVRHAQTFFHENRISGCSFKLPILLILICMFIFLSIECLYHRVCRA